MCSNRIKCCGDNGRKATRPHNNQFVSSVFAYTYYAVLRYAHRILLYLRTRIDFAFGVVSSLTRFLFIRCERVCSRANETEITVCLLFCLSFDAYLPANCYFQSFTNSTQNKYIIHSNNNRRENLNN